VVSDIYGNLYRSSRRFRLYLFMAGETMGKTQRTESRLKAEFEPLFYSYEIQIIKNLILMFLLTNDSNFAIII